MGLEFGVVGLRVGDRVAHDDVDETAVLGEGQNVGRGLGRPYADRSHPLARVTDRGGDERRHGQPGDDRYPG